MFRHQIDHDINVIYLLVGITMTWWPPTSKIAFEVEEPRCDVPPSHAKWMKNIETKSKTIQNTIPDWTFHEIPVFGVGAKEGSKQFLKIRKWFLFFCIFFLATPPFVRIACCEHVKTSQN